MKCSTALLAALASTCTMAAPGLAQTAASLTLAPIWGDHGVIQRDHPILVAGHAAPAAAITATLGDAQASATADAKGSFTLRFPARPASAAPTTLSVKSGSATVTVSDLLVGDVWLCSGQSNMEYPLLRALAGPSEVWNAGPKGDDGLRLITIPKAIGMQALDHFGKPVHWEAATRATVPDFSAACYLMARDLRKALGVPVGAIHASWGGSQSRAWLSPQAGLALYGAPEMEMQKRFDTDPLGAVTAFAPRWEAWYRGTTGGTQPWLKPDGLSWNPVPKISGWLAWEGTALAQKALGTVWLRRQVTLTAAQAKAGARLTLGVLDDMDMTYVNGHAGGNSFGWDYERDYAVPPALLHAGVNEIMVAVTNSYDDGGFKSPQDRLALAITGGARLPLQDGWRFSISPATTYPPRAPWDANGGIGVMHNGMIAPLGQIALKGVAWYQGESDVDVPGYRQRMTALIAGWRAQFGADTRALVVQIANYGPVQLAAGPSKSAELREAQLLAATDDANAALVTAIDVGEYSDIHPANKQAVGHRLALAAQGVALPMPLSATRQGESVRVRFTGIEGGLHAWSGTGPLSFELCGKGAAGCRLVAASIDGDSVLLPTGGGPAALMRYGWAESPTLNLYDGRALPLPGFELTVTGG